jgi:hypothetical protein
MQPSRVVRGLVPIRLLAAGIACGRASNSSQDSALTPAGCWAGFQGVEEFEENRSDDPQLRDVEESDTGVNTRWSAYETMILEAEKPTASTNPE